jgi:hypothetical protein
MLHARTHRVSSGCGPIARDKCEPGGWVAMSRGYVTSISRKFSGGPYSSSNDCERASGSDCMVTVVHGEVKLVEVGWRKRQR